MFLLIILSIKFHPSYNDYEIIESSSKEYGLLVEKKYNCNSTSTTFGYRIIYNSSQCKLKYLVIAS